MLGRRRLAALRRRRRDRRGRLPHDHRPQEGHPDHGRRQERRARRTSRTRSRRRRSSRRHSCSATGGPYVAALDHARPGEAAAGSRTRTSSSAACRRSSTRSNRELSRFEQIKRFAILPRDFSADEGEVTPTLKLKRRVRPGALRRRDRGALRRLEPAGADEGRRVPAAACYEILTTSPVCGAWMNCAAADVDADVAEAVEEDEVAGLELGSARPGCRSRTARTSCAGARRPSARRRTSRSRSSRSRTATAPPQTYGVPRYCIAIPTTPP